MILRNDLLETLLNEAGGIADQFKIYLQTLLSRTLDSNFFQEIFKEQGIAYISYAISNLYFHIKYDLFYRRLLFTKYYGSIDRLVFAQDEHVEGIDQNEETFPGNPFFSWLGAFCVPPLVFFSPRNY